MFNKKDIKKDQKSTDSDIEIGDETMADDSVVEEENMAETIKKLREKLKTIEAERMEYLTGWQRAKADMVNARKRDDEDKKEFMKFANERLIEGIIPVLESFELAMANKESWEKADKNWRIGVEYIYSQLKKALEDSGLTELKPLNSKFDHSVHEAASYEPVADEKLDHVVLRVIQNGYYLNGKLMRPAKVVVGEFKKDISDK
jgi:molecular chaperone GrpE